MAANAFPGIRGRETLDPRDLGVHIPLRGRYLRPRAVRVDQTPAKILDTNPNRLGAWIFNNGGQVEIPLPMPNSASGLALAKVLDTGGLALPGSSPSTYKSLYLLVDTQLAWVTAAQPTIQLVVGRAPWAPASGAVSQAGGNTQNFLKGAAVNLGPAAATSLAVGLWPFSPFDIADLQWHHPYVGAELTFGSALTAGSARLFLELPGGPSLFLGEDNLVNIDRLADAAGSWSITAQSAAQWVPSDGEIWAAAALGGSIDVRIWEVLIEALPPGVPSYA